LLEQFVVGQGREFGRGAAMAVLGHRPAGRILYC